MGERLDPESVRRVMSRYYAEMRTVLERHGGTVEKFIGDAVVGAFGVPTVHEDDALRAVRAAADMRNVLGDLNDELDERWGVRLQVRTGVNTGKVVAGDASQGQAFLVGDAVNVAARLEQTAGAGEILIGEPTYRLVRDAVTVEETAPLSLKGKAEPLSAFKLLDISRHRPALARRVESPIVGRELELATLQDSFARAVEGRRCALCTIMGPAGIGKSRLSEEFVAARAGEARVLRGRCLPYGEGITYWPVAEIVRQAAGLAEDESLAHARDKITGLISAEVDAAQIVDRVGVVLGLSEMATSPEETFWGVRRLLQALANERPHVVIFDDLHWAETILLSLIEHLAEHGHGGPLLLLCLARSEFVERRPDFGRLAGDTATVALDPLNAYESEQLITNLVGEGNVPAELARRVSAHTAGNPLYVGEMVRMLVDEKILDRDGGRWNAVDKTAELMIPPTIEALVASRLDQLDATERALLERAAVIGQEFSRGAVLELHPQSEAEAVDAPLESLEQKALIRREEAVFAGEPAYSFTHLLVRDVAYDGLLKESRSVLHERFAAWLQAKVGDQLAGYEEIIGYHLEQSYRYRAEIGTVDDVALAVGKKAAEHLASAGRKAFVHGDVAAAASLLTRAASSLPANDRIRVALQLDLAAALIQAGELTRADDLVADTIDAAARQNEFGLELRSKIVRLGLQLFAGSEGRTEDALAELDRAIPRLEELGEERTLAMAWRLKTDLHLVGLRTVEMEAAGEKGLEYARQSGDAVEAHEIQMLLAIALTAGPTRVPIAVARAEALLAEAEDDLRVKVYALQALALLNAMRGDFDEARRRSATAKAISEELGWRLLLGAGVPQVDGEVELLAGEPAAAESALRAGYELLVEMGEKGFLSTVAAMLAEALYRQGRDEEAERFTESSKEAADSEDVLSQLQWRGVRAKLLARQGRLAEAESLAREAVALSQAGDSPNTQGNALMNLAEVLWLANRGPEAVAIVDDAIGRYDAKGNGASAESARVARERLRRTPRRAD